MLFSLIHHRWTKHWHLLFLANIFGLNHSVTFPKNIAMAVVAEFRVCKFCIKSEPLFYSYSMFLPFLESKLTQLTTMNRQSPIPTPKPR